MFGSYIFIIAKKSFDRSGMNMTDVLLRHKGIIFFISLVIISLFLLTAYLMPKSSKIPSKGVFVVESCQLHDT